MHKPFEEQLTPRWQLVLRGIKRTQAIGTSRSSHLPITLHIMCATKDCLLSQPYSHPNIMLWAACCLAFFGFLRVSEFRVPCHSNYDSQMYLSLTDIALDSRNNPRLIAVSIKQSKTNPFRKGVTLYLGATNHPVCPVSCILPYLALRNKQPGPLFLTREANPSNSQYFPGCCAYQT